MKTIGKVALGCGIAAVVGVGLVVVIAVGIYWMGSKRTSRPAPETSGPVSAIEAASSSAPEPAPPTSEVSQEPESTTPSASRYVVIDSREAAYTVYQVIPASRYDEAQRKVGSEAGIEIVPWDAFRKDTDRYLKARIRSLEVDPQDRLTTQLVETIESAGGPVGITWNGGIAITYTDYQAAKRTYQQAH